MRKTCLNEIHKLAQRDERVVFVGSDIGTGTLDAFQAEFPDRFFMEGVSESHLIGMMTGLAMNGKLPYFNTIATFLTRRAYEQLLLDAGLHRQPLRLIGSGGGLVYSPLGPTHLAVDDIALMRTIPNMTIIAPCDAEEMKRLMPQTLDLPGPIYIRLMKGGDRIVSSAACPFTIGKAILLQEAEGDHRNKVLFITTGITTGIALDAAQLLKEHDVATSVLHCHTIKPLDEKQLLDCMKHHSVVITMEEHSKIGGLGSAVAELFAEASFEQKKRFRRIALPDIFHEEYGSQDSTLAACGITAKAAAETALTLGIQQERV